jgi:hypothetical protein
MTNQYTQFHFARLVNTHSFQWFMQPGRKVLYLYSQILPGETGTKIYLTPHLRDKHTQFPYMYMIQTLTLSYAGVLLYV